MKTRGSWISTLAACWVVVFAAVSGAHAGSTGAIYNMERMLSEPHPFARPFDPRLHRARPTQAPRQPAAPLYRPALSPTPSHPAYRSSTTPAPAPVTRPAQYPAAVQNAQRSGEEGLGGLLSEVRVGVLWHDQGPFSHQKEGGADGNLEVLFVAPDMLDFVWSPRPHVGISVNSSGDTSQAYVGFVWEWDFWEVAFAGFSLGGAVHDGKTRTEELDRKELGCRVLFRESINAGYRFDDTHSVMLQLDHISNAKLCSTNEGLESVGLRYGYRF